MEFVWLKRKIVEFIPLMVYAWAVTLALFYGVDSADKEIAMDSILQLVFVKDALPILLFLSDYVLLEP